MTHGTNTLLFDCQLEYTFQDDKLAELDRQLALLLSTQAGTMPLDREFGIQMDFVSKHTPLPTRARGASPSLPPR